MARSPTADGRPAALAVTLAALAMLAAGCAPQRTDRTAARIRHAGAPGPAGVRPREGAGPLWEWDELPDGRLNYRVLHPLVEGQASTGRRVFVLRPLFSLEDDGAGSTRWKFRALWPLLLVERDGDSRRVRIFPVVWDRDRSKADGTVRDRDFWVLPFFWAGSDTEEGGYFALWPFGGVLKGVLGKQYIRFVLWPLWVETQDKNYHSWNFPWPVLGVWHGPDQRGWRVWPLFGVNTRDGRFRRVFFLWPLGHWWDTGLDTDSPGRVRALLPFFGLLENRDSSYVTVLWPLFARLVNRRSGFVEWHAPWPLFSRAHGQGLRGLKLFPLYEHRLAPDVSNVSFGWKVLTCQFSRDAERSTTVVSAFLVFRSVRDEWLEHEIDGRTVRRPLPRDRRSQRLAAERAGLDPELAGRRERPPDQGRRHSRVSTLLWPIFRYNREDDGRLFFTMLEPWPWPRKDCAVWDRHYGPFFTLWRYERLADGTRRQTSMFNLQEHSYSPVERRLRLSPVFDYWRRGDPGEYKRFRILGGLWGYERRGTDRRVRLFWIPIGRRPEGWE